jgi:hypothetical protein
MRTLPVAFVALILAGSPICRAAAQAPTSDIRTLSLRSLRAGWSVRIAGRDIGTITGTLVGVRDGALWLNSYPPRDPVPLAGIDSVWVGHNHHVAGGVIGLVVGSVVARMIASSKTCSALDNGCIESIAWSFLGITTAGAVLGSVIGSGLKRWERRYP